MSAAMVTDRPAGPITQYILVQRWVGVTEIKVEEFMILSFRY